MSCHGRAGITWLKCGWTRDETQGDILERIILTTKCLSRAKLSRTCRFTGTHSFVVAPWRAGSALYSDPGSCGWSVDGGKKRLYSSSFTSWFLNAKRRARETSRRCSDWMITHPTPPHPDWVTNVEVCAQTSCAVLQRKSWWNQCYSERVGKVPIIFDEL